jgi:hypothetical protein
VLSLRSRQHRDVRSVIRRAPGLHLFFAIGLTACVSLSEPQIIDTDVDRWPHYEFSDGSITVAIQVPPHFGVFNRSLPEPTYTRAQRLLLDPQYDFGAGAASYTSEFEIKVNLVQLSTPLNITRVTANELDSALASAVGHPIQSTGSTQPVEESIRGRAWVHYDNTAEVTYSQTRETYATVISSTTALLITGWYGPNIRKNPRWFDSRRRILRDVRDNTTIAD